MPLVKLKFIKKYFPLVLFVLSLFFIVKTLFLNYYPDFGQYYWGLKEIFQGNSPYLAGRNIFTISTYPPFVFILMSPFEILSYFWAEKIWTLFSINFLIGSVYLIFKINNEKMFSRMGFLISALLFAFYFPIKFTLGMGQINFLILFLVTLSIYFLNKNKNYISGTFLSLSIMIKFFPLFFLPYLIILKKWRMFFFFIILSVIILLFTFIINPDINVYYYKNVLPALFGGWKTDYYNQSLSGFLGRQMDNGYARELLRIFISLILVSVSYLVILKNNSQKTAIINLCFSLLTTLTLLINNFSWQHHFVWLIFPFITIFYFIKNKRLGWSYYFVLGLSFFLIGLNLKNPNIFPVIFASHVFYGALILWGLNLYLLFYKTSEVKT